ncbi:hypothetical protein E2C01_083983 [Portunus trituberculatus]|uniref:Uncharacterized protein n=1 Tax=Portunus trituberculatus TaxID=210409 RepID=A0A5B7J2U1_PORTR|nr:hypothetical protein [Portunus trituberculatus]
MAAKLWQEDAPARNPMQTATITRPARGATFTASRIQAEVLLMEIKPAPIYLPRRTIGSLESAQGKPGGPPRFAPPPVSNEGASPRGGGTLPVPRDGLARRTKENLPRNSPRDARHYSLLTVLRIKSTASRSLLAFETALAVKVPVSI